MPPKGRQNDDYSNRRYELFPPLDRCIIARSGTGVYLARAGDVSDEEMFQAFNMGLGLLIVCAPQLIDATIELLSTAGERPLLVGRIVSGARGVVYER